MKKSEKAFKSCKSVAEAFELGCREATVGEVPEYPGLFIARLASPEQQMELVKACMMNYMRAPNKMNILKEGKGYRCRAPKSPDETLWEIESPFLDAPGDGVPRDLRLSQVRWVTLGYQYDWTRRTYPPRVVPGTEGDSDPPFPERLADVCSGLAHGCGYHSFKAEAGIVNFYSSGAVMGAHQDEVEETHEPPVVSISIGPDCVFLVGGLTREETPTALLLRTGDVVVMGGPSRLLFHAVPRVFVEQGLPPVLEALRADLLSRGDVDGVRALNFLHSTRININVRQVYSLS